VTFIDTKIAATCSSETLMTSNPIRQTNKRAKTLLRTKDCCTYSLLHAQQDALTHNKEKQKQIPWPQPASELYRPSDRRLSTKLVPIFVDRGCRVVSASDPYGLFLGFLDQCSYFFFQATPQLHSRGLVDPVPDPLLRKSGSAVNRTRTSGSVARNSDH
jgi:hypothetical protein